MPTPACRRSRALVAIVWALVALASATSAQAPPQEPSLLERVRASLASDELIDERYTYRTMRRTYELSALGKLSPGPVRVFEVGPSPVDPSQIYRRLVAVDGRPVSEDEQRKRDEKHRAEALKRLRETPTEHARRLQKETEEAQEARARLDDAMRVFAFERQGHEVVDGRSLLAVSVTPRPDVRTRTKAGKQMKKLRGRAWIDEAAGQLVRIEMEVVEDISLGFGIIGHVDAGSRMMYRRAPQADGTWAPVEARFTGSGATLVFRQFALETWAKYTDYRPRGASNGTTQPAPAP